MNKEEINEQIEKALAKKAVGYNLDEVVEEYAVDEEGGVKLVKKKITKKYIPPDLSSAKVLLDKYRGVDISQMSDEELLKEKQRLLKELKELDENGDWKMSKENQMWF